jgi:transcriptional regulator with XRE-family HTH domain
MARGPKPDLKRLEQARALRAQGLTLVQVGQRLGVTRQAVTAMLRRPKRPAAACPGCGAARSRAGVGARGDRAALCLACLGKRPGATAGQRLKAARLAAGLSQAELAARAGLSPHALCECEGGRVRPHERTLVRLAQALGYSREARFGPGPPVKVKYSRRGRPRKDQAPPAAPEPAAGQKKRRRGGPSTN